jgi:hypothetical protein
MACPDSSRIANLFLGTIISCTPARELVIHRDALLGAFRIYLGRLGTLHELRPLSSTAVDVEGFIRHFESQDSSASKALLATVDPEHVVRISEDGFLLPGFVDTHGELFFFVSGYQC